MNREITNYKNGNTWVRIYSDGTKIREYPDNEQPEPEFPESIDLKITDRCRHNCPYCYEGCIETGRHCKLSDLEIIFDRDYPGVEVAIGGGNPLLHPELTDILYFFKSRKMIANITINQKDIRSYFKYINRMVSEKLLYGIGISIVDENTIIEDSKLINGHKVYHTIIGVLPLTAYKELSKLDDDIIRILILGFKFNKGRGVYYYADNFKSIQKDFLLFNIFFKNLFSDNRMIIAFDNLAIEQLRLKDFLPEEYEKHYMGDDGQFSMYIDAVNMRYAKSSLIDVKDMYSIDNHNLTAIFQSIKSTKT